MLMLPLYLTLLGCTSSPAPRPKGLHPLSIDFLLMEIDAKRSRPRIYNFWATWCGPCLAELPALRAFGRSHPEVDVIFVNVDQASLRDKKVRPTIQRMQLTEFEHIALDDKDPAFALNRVKGWPNSIPVTFVVTSGGERVKQFNTRVNATMLESALEGVR